MSHTKTFVIDFDSTFVSVEALDELARIALADHPDRIQILGQLVDLTTQGMEGKIGFAESLKQRLKLFNANRQHIEQLIDYLNTHITASVKHNESFFKNYANHIYIISGGFTDYIRPVVEPFGLRPEQVLANHFKYSSTGQITGYDQSCPLAHNNGKVEQLTKLNLPKPITIIGDGFTDYLVKKAGQAHQFLAFTENVSRPTVTQLADQVVANFDQVIEQQFAVLKVNRQHT